MSVFLRTHSLKTDEPSSRVRPITHQRAAFLSCVRRRSRISREYGLNCDPNWEILITTRGTQATFITVMNSLNDDDEVLIQDPGFIARESGVRLVGGRSVHRPVLEENDFKSSSDDVTSLVTDKSRVIMTNSPNNPPTSLSSTKR